MLIAYLAHTWLKTRKPVPASIHWTIHSKWSPIIPTIAVVLSRLAVLFPSPKHDRLDMLYIVAIGVIGEEIFFRGLLWDFIDHRTSDTYFLRLSITVWLTALLFGVMHLQYHHFQIHLASIFQTIYSSGVGLILGVIRQRTKSVVPPMFAHSAFNSLFNLMLTAAQ